MKLHDHEIIKGIEDLLATASDDAQRERVMAWMRSQCGVSVQPAYVYPSGVSPSWVPAPGILPSPAPSDLREPWKFEITCGDNAVTIDNSGIRINSVSPVTQFGSSDARSLELV